MCTGWKSKKFAGVFFLCLAVLCLGSLSLADAAAAHSQKKTKKPAAPPLPPLPSGPTGPVQQIPLDSIAPVPPQVSFLNGQLTIVAPNSTLGDILRAIRKQTGAEIEIPEAKERVVTHLGPGPARDVVADLLNGSRFNYVLLGSPEDANLLTRVVLVAKGPDNANPNNPGSPQQQAMAQQPNMAPNLQEGADVNDAEATDENSPPDENSDQNAAEEQQPPPQDQPGVKTPQQMLQEMQQRQLQLQQQQQQGQPPVPGPSVPPRPPQEQ